MSHSQFHCTARVYLDMHGLSFETSICYWQDQPGSRHPRRRRGAARERPDSPGPPARAPPTLTAPALSPLRPAGAASRTRRWRHGGDGRRRRRPAASRPGGAWGGERRHARGTPLGHGRPRRPALPATPRARSRDRCAAFLSPLGCEHSARLRLLPFGSRSREKFGAFSFPPSLSLSLGFPRSRVSPGPAPRFETRPRAGSHGARRTERGLGRG